MALPTEERRDLPPAAEGAGTLGPRVSVESLATARPVPESLGEGLSATVRADRRSLRDRVPAPLKAWLRPAKRAYRRATSNDRVLPNALVIGAAKSGTTALYAYLGANPAISRAEEKEVHFFDTGYNRGVRWYRAQFPRHGHLESIRERLGVEPIACEATPYYLAHPLAPYRIRGLLPAARFIVLLRDPVERAVSHYHHNVQIGFEELSLEDAVRREPKRLEGELERILSAPLYNSFSHQHHSYLARGRYAEQLATWLSLFSRDQFLVLDANRFFEDPGIAVRRSCEFLGVPVHALSAYQPIGARNYPQVDRALMESLSEYFAPHNARLWELIGERFSWS